MPERRLAIRDRKAGDLLAAMEKDKGGGDTRKHRSRDVTGVTLDSLGITKMQSHRMQRLAAENVVEPIQTPTSPPNASHRPPCPKSPATV